MQESHPNDPAPWVRVIVVNYNGGPYIQRALDALAAQTDGRFEAVIVDNASTDGSAEALKLPDPRFRLIRSPTNLGFAAANNLAARDCGLAWLATLNPDTVPSTGWLGEFESATRRYPTVAMFGATLLDAANPALLDGFGDVYSVFGFPWRGGGGMPLETAPREDAAVFSPCAAAALFRADVFRAAGGFDESFFCYLEDVDLGCRLRLRGERCIQLRNALVYHVGSAISGRESDFTTYHSVRNRIWVILKNAPGPLLARMALIHLYHCVRQVLVHRRKGKPVMPVLRGIAHGISGLGAIWPERRAIQRARKVTARQFGQMLAWDLQQFRKRKIVVLDEAVARKC
jgi:GT2 family glycosyltransferase